MGYETLVLPCETWQLEFKHNDSDTRVSINEPGGVSKYVTLTRAQAQQLKRHLNSALPVDFDND